MATERMERRDTSVMEYTAEDLIAHRLQRFGILVAKPKFDQLGTDLIALRGVQKSAKFCRIQCKGRSLLNSKTPSTEVYVFQDDVDDSFVVCLFVETGDADATHLFALFGREIKTKWKKGTREKRDAFYLRINKSELKNMAWLQYRLTNERVGEIIKLIEHADLTGVFESYFDVTGHGHATTGAVTAKAKGTFTPPKVS